MLMSAENTFGYVTGNVLSTRPASPFGTSITPGNNTYGSYTEILSDASVVRDCYGIMININGIFVSTAAKDSLTTIGIDTAGGTAYVDFISGLLSSCAGPYLQGCGGHWYYFPVFIPSGTAIAAKGSVNNGTVGTQSVAIWLYGAPSHPHNIFVGSGVESIGVVAATSKGTNVTSGTASEGAWTSLGSTTKNCKFWQMGMGINDGTMTTGQSYHTDLSYGDGTNQVMIDRDKKYDVNSSSEVLECGLRMPSCVNVPIGGTIYGRMQCSGTADSGTSMAAYGVY